MSILATLRFKVHMAIYRPQHTKEEEFTCYCENKSNLVSAGSRSQQLRDLSFRGLTLTKAPSIQSSTRRAWVAIEVIVRESWFRSDTLDCLLILLSSDFPLRETACLGVGKSDQRYNSAWFNADITGKRWIGFFSSEKI
ncbi:hypothetical protein Cni_G19197 [Canna indica]|uniref:Uncharacterized protein n=1 Tax=Canna indica TaxID=4628 RepID=A0AAQ3KR38_9LILI|nr:hypothetical protein Cni_G19197 [Canna indica]